MFRVMAGILSGLILLAPAVPGVTQTDQPLDCTECHICLQPSEANPCLKPRVVPGIHLLPGSGVLEEKTAGMGRHRQGVEGLNIKLQAVQPLLVPQALQVSRIAQVVLLKP